MGRGVRSGRGNHATGRCQQQESLREKPKTEISVKKHICFLRRKSGDNGVVVKTSIDFQAE